MAFLDFLNQPVGGYKTGKTNPAAGGTERLPMGDMTWGGLLGGLMQSDPRDKALGQFIQSRSKLPRITAPGMTAEGNIREEDFGSIIKAVAASLGIPGL